MKFLNPKVIVAFTRGQFIAFARGINISDYQKFNNDVPKKNWMAYYHFARIGASQNRRGIKARNSNFISKSRVIARFLGPAIMRHMISNNEIVSISHYFNHSLSQNHFEENINHDFHVTVIIPVFGAPEAVGRCLRSVKNAETYISHNVIVIDDLSPNPEDRISTQKLASELDFQFIQNPENLGFVRTSNIGLLESPGHALLLNSDTQVFDFWLEAFANSFSEDTGTITPISNNATIYSIPSTRELHGLDDVTFARKMASTLRIINLSPWEIPTAHGFCMFFSQRAISQVGLFNYDAFGHGYGEENDYSMRVEAKGLKNLLTPKTYVFHEGSASFGDSVSARQKIANENLLSLWPNYPKQISKYLSNNPLPEIETLSRVQNLLQHNQLVDIHFSHRLGGGIDKAILLECMKSLEIGIHSVVIRPGNSSNSIRLEIFDDLGNYNLPIDFGHSPKEISENLAKLNISSVVVHHQIGFQILGEILTSMSKPYTFRLHDFYTICPFINLVDESGEYCGEPGVAGCNSCVARRRPEILDIETWRINSSQILYDAEMVIAPSSDTRTRLLSHFPKLDIKVSANPAEKLQVNFIAASDSKKVAVLGELSINKGLNTVKQLVKALPEDVIVVLIGFIPDALLDGDIKKSIKSGKLIVTGKYVDDSQALHILKEISPTYILFPGRIPETYSYTLDIAMATGISILGCNVGAMPERLSTYKNFTLFETNDSIETIAGILLQ